MFVTYIHTYIHSRSHELGEHIRQPAEEARRRKKSAGSPSEESNLEPRKHNSYAMTSAYANRTLNLSRPEVKSRVWADTRLRRMVETPFRIAYPPACGLIRLPPKQHIPYAPSTANAKANQEPRRQLTTRTKKRGLQQKRKEEVQHVISRSIISLLIDD